MTGSWDKDDIFQNITSCKTYIPGIDEYRDALGGLWLTFVLVGCATCILLYILFLDQMFAAFKDAHVVYRNSLIWIASVYPFMTLMTIIGFAIPRSQEVCYAVKVFYLMISMSKFSDLTVLLYGSEEVLLWKVQGSSYKTNVGPLCCFFFCLPRFRFTKIRLRVILGGIRQLPYTQSFFLVMIMILQSANQIVVGSLDPRGSYFWLNIFSVITSLSGVYALNILSTVSSDHLHEYHYTQMSFVMKTLIIVTKLQSLLFNVLAYYEIFPCIPPISHYEYRQTVENFFYLFEMLIFGIWSYWIYRGVKFSSANPTVIRTDPRGNLFPHHEAYLPSMSGHVEEYGYGFPGTDFLDNCSDEIDADEERRRTDTYDFSGTTLVISPAGEDSSVTLGGGYQRIN